MEYKLNETQYYKFRKYQMKPNMELHIIPT